MSHQRRLPLFVDAWPSSLPWPLTYRRGSPWAWPGKPTSTMKSLRPSPRRLASRKFFTPNQISRMAACFYYWSASTELSRPGCCLGPVTRIIGRSMRIRSRRCHRASQVLPRLQRWRSSSTLFFLLFFFMYTSFLLFQRFRDPGSQRSRDPEIFRFRLSELLVLFLF